MQDVCEFANACVSVKYWLVICTGLCVVYLIVWLDPMVIQRDAGGALNSQKDQKIPKQKCALEKWV